MSDNRYKIVGNIVIPQEKKEEFNQYILQILYKGGIRKTEQMQLGGREVTVVNCPVPDSQGIVSFDYSIFEKRKRETATYDTNTCELITPDRGYQEFGVVMNIRNAFLNWRKSRRFGGLSERTVIPLALRQ